MSDTDVVPMNALSLSAAQRDSEAAISAARSKDIAACVAVCDPSGAAIVTIRMDGSPRLSAEVALNKAYSVAEYLSSSVARSSVLLAYRVVPRRKTGRSPRPAPAPLAQLTSEAV